MIEEYQKKPIVVEAVQWTGDNIQEITDWVGVGLVRTWGGGQNQFLSKDPTDSLKIYIKKSDTWGGVSRGSWIIAEPDGDGFYPCINEQFKITYEKDRRAVGVEDVQRAAPPLKNVD